MGIETRLALFASHAELLGKCTEKQSGTKVSKSYDIRGVSGEFLASLQASGDMGSVVSALKAGKPEDPDTRSCIGACKILANAPLVDLAEFTSDQLKSICDSLMVMMLNENDDIRSISEKALVNMFGADGLKTLIVNGECPELRQED